MLASLLSKELDLVEPISGVVGTQVVVGQRSAWENAFTVMEKERLMFLPDVSGCAGRSQLVRLRLGRVSRGSVACACGCALGMDAGARPRATMTWLAGLVRLSIGAPRF